MVFVPVNVPFIQKSIIKRRAFIKHAKETSYIIHSHNTRTQSCVKKKVKSFANENASHMYV